MPNFSDLKSKDIINLFILSIVMICILITMPFLTKKFLKLTFNAPFSEKRQAIIANNKTHDAASGIKGTFVNNVPMNLFESMTNISSKSFSKVEIQIPKIYVSSPMFNMSKYGEELQNIWIGSINESNLKKEFKTFEIYYNNSLINKDGKAYSSEAVPYNDIEYMKKQLVSELDINGYRFKKWYKVEDGLDTTDASYVKDGIKIKANFEIKDWTPNFWSGPTIKTVEATFVEGDNGLELKGELKVK